VASCCRRGYSFPGSEYHEQVDAETFVDWGVDYLKLDGAP